MIARLKMLVEQIKTDWLGVVGVVIFLSMIGVACGALGLLFFVIWIEAPMQSLFFTLVSCAAFGEIQFRREQRRSEDFLSGSILKACSLLVRFTKQMNEINNDQKFYADSEGYRVEVFKLDNKEER